MRKNLTGLVMLLATLLTACGADQPSPTVALTLTNTNPPTLTHTLPPTSTLTATPTLTDTPKPSITPTPTDTPIPPTETPNALGIRLPAGEPLSEWKGIPIMPGAIAGEESTEGAPSYSFTVNAETSAVTGFYNRELAKLGWRAAAVGTGPTGNLLALFMKGSDVLSVSVLVVDSSQKLLYVMLILT